MKHRTSAFSRGQSVKCFVRSRDVAACFPCLCKMAATYFEAARTLTLIVCLPFLSASATRLGAIWTGKRWGDALTRLRGFPLNALKSPTLGLRSKGDVARSLGVSDSKVRFDVAWTSALLQRHRSRVICNTWSHACRRNFCQFSPLFCS